MTYFGCFNLCVHNSFFLSNYEQHTFMTVPDIVNWDAQSPKNVQSREISKFNETYFNHLEWIVQSDAHGSGRRAR